MIARDAAGDTVALAFFGGGSGYARKLLPLNEPRAVSGKLERYDQWLQIVHPEVMTPDEAKALPAREATYALSEGLTAKRLAGLVSLQALARAPELPEWIEPSLLAKRRLAGVARGARPTHPCRSGRCQGARTARL